MSPGNLAPNSCKLLIGNWLFVILEPPLSRPPDYLVSYRASHLDGSQAGCSPDRLPENLDNNLGCCLLGHPADHLPKNRLRYREDRLVRNLAGHRADCLENHLEENPADNLAGYLPSNRADCLVGSPANHLHGNPVSYLPGPKTMA